MRRAGDGNGRDGGGIGSAAHLQVVGAGQLSKGVFWRERRFKYHDRAPVVELAIGWQRFCAHRRFPAHDGCSRA